jgi:hypothetical protein
MRPSSSADGFIGRLRGLHQALLQQQLVPQDREQQQQAVPAIDVPNASKYAARDTRPSTA